MRVRRLQDGGIAVTRIVGGLYDDRQTLLGR